MLDYSDFKNTLYQILIIKEQIQTLRTRSNSPTNVHEGKMS